MTYDYFDYNIEHPNCFGEWTFLTSLKHLSDKNFLSHTTISQSSYKNVRDRPHITSRMPRTCWLMDSKKCNYQ